MLIAGCLTNFTDVYFKNTYLLVLISSKLTKELVYDSYELKNSAAFEKIRSALDSATWLNLRHYSASETRCRYSPSLPFKLTRQESANG